MEDLIARVSLNTEICHGKPTIRNSRYMVESILEYLAGGDSIEDVLSEFPDLQKEDVLACIAYATASMKLKDVQVTTA